MKRGMDNQTFQQILDAQIEKCRNTMAGKAEEYADDVDRLHNFRVAAALENCTMEQALAGMMVKHTVSIYDMISSGADFPMAEWEEKIGDHLNYLFLLKAIVVEKENNLASAVTSGPSIFAYPAQS